MFPGKDCPIDARQEGAEDTERLSESVDWPIGTADEAVSGRDKGSYCTDLHLRGKEEIDDGRQRSSEKSKKKDISKKEQDIRDCPKESNHS